MKSYPRTNFPQILLPSAETKLKTARAGDHLQLKLAYDSYVQYRTGKGSLY
jgi:hypothetical protein